MRGYELTDGHWDAVRGMKPVSIAGTAGGRGATTGRC